MPMNTTIDSAAGNTTETQKQVKPDFGNGRYSALAEECWKGAKAIFGLDSHSSEKLARMIATDFGAAMANQTVKVGKMSKVSKDGKVTLKEAVVAKGVTSTLPLSALKALQFATEAGKNGFLPLKTKWAVTQQLEEFFVEKLS